MIFFYSSAKVYWTLSVLSAFFLSESRRQLRMRLQAHSVILFLAAALLWH
jgi:hypothetical protein